ncbi:MAG: NAD+ synthase [Magnetococcales bacterium]|nr:NAD+ synthase [Magnetococcales bacterium]
MDILIAMAQVNPHVGALEGNLERLLAAARRARGLGAELCVFPELALTGYPPEDLLLKPLFLERLEEVERRFRQGLASIGIAAVYGSPRRAPGGLRNAAVLTEGGRELGWAGKHRLPNYGVFDEWRYFEPESRFEPLTWRGVKWGLTICEDIWHAGAPSSALAAAGARVLLNLNASPYHIGKHREREEMVARRAVETGLPVLYVNQVGGQDELVFDGGSFALNPPAVPGGEPEIAARMALFEEGVAVVRLRIEEGAPARFLPQPAPEREEAPREIYRALCLGLRDYVDKNGFSGVVLGLSGGVDSALTAAIAVDALGPERVHALMMPSAHTAQESLDDAADCARRMGIPLAQTPIGPMQERFHQVLEEAFPGLMAGVTEENVQPRIRATLLMALSNRRGWLLVTTGNKSEVSTGYATLYGDMAGGFSVLKDLLKEEVYRLCEARNAWAEVEGQEPPIPRRVIDKPPSAELRPGQQDTDSLPPYPVLDPILRLYVEEERSPEEIAALGFDRETVIRVARLVDGNEYKRRQACPGVRITRRAFGKDRRYPITNGFRAG